MTSVYEKITTKVRLFICGTGGAVAVIFGLTIPILVASVGVSMDIAQSYMVRQRLGHALDASALAAAAMATEDTDLIEAKVNDFITQNYPPEKIGTAMNIEVDLEGTELTVSASAQLDTSFMRLFGFDTVTVSAQSIVQREVRGLEVVLVLDNTGSMSTNDNIGALRTATTNFINIMFDRVSDPEDIKIGLVPYSNSVRIGRYGIGLLPDGVTVYGDGTPFVTLPAGVSYTTNHGSGGNWYGCVVEHMDNGYQSTATHQSGTKGQLWRYSGNWTGHGWNPALSDNDPYPQDVEDDYEGPWDIYMQGKIISSGQECDDYSGLSNSRCSNCTGSGGNCASSYCYCWKSQPNDGCPLANVHPLSSDRDSLLARVVDMQPNGNTLGNIGMLWGYRMVSPEEPFSEGSEWGSEYWEKAVVLMTDGANTIDSGSTGYSYYGPGSKNVMTVDDLNERLVEVCAAMKAQDILIYTVTFYSNIDDDTKEFYRQCATDPTKYYDAPSQDDLVDVFEKISRELSKLHIKG